MTGQQIIEYIKEHKLEEKKILPNNLIFRDAFGIVCWTDEDLVEALSDHEIEATEGNISWLRYKCDRDRFIERMIEAGWDYIYAEIEEMIREGEIC